MRSKARILDPMMHLSFAAELPPETTDVEDFDFSDFAARFLNRELLLSLVILAFLGTRLWLLAGFDALLSDTRTYGHNARLGIDCRQAAYRDFRVGYPPLAWWLMTVPRVVESERYTEPTLRTALFPEYYTSYRWWFHLELFLVDVLCFGLMFLIGRQISRVALWLLPLAYTAITIAQPHLLYDRLDIGLLLFFLLGVYCWQRSLEPSPLTDRWACASYLFLGLGFSFKILSILWVPFLLVADWQATKSAWKMTQRLAWLAVGAAGPFLIQARTSGWSVFFPFRHHGERGIQMESVWGSVLLIARRLGVPCEVTHSHGGFNLTGELAPTMKIVAIASVLTTGLSLGIWALLRGRRFDRSMALDCAYLALINSIVLATVFSPQYLDWIVPISLLLALSVLPKHWAAWCAFAVPIVAALAISSWLFPYHYRDDQGLVKLGALAVLLSEIRSGCLLALAFGLSVGFFAKYGLMPWHVMTPVVEPALNA
jgi:hypothetical protein